MITLNYKDDTFLIKNGLDELTINEFENISLILSEEGDDFYKWILVLNYLGLPTEIIDDMEVDDVNTVINALNIGELDLETYITEFTLDDKTYEVTNNFTVKQIMLVEDYVETLKKHIGEVMAIVFKEKGVDKDEHLNHKTISKNGDLFRHNITMDIVIPYINLLTSNIYVKNSQLNG